MATDGWYAFLENDTPLVTQACLAASQVINIRRTSGQGVVLRERASLQDTLKCGKPLPEKTPW